MHERIRTELDRVERHYDARVLWAVESGSRAWGFASRDSDWDVRFVYVRRPEWYLALEPGRDVIEAPIEDALDLSGWDARKALNLLRRGNAVLPEWLDSPIVYRERGPLAATLKDMLPAVFRPRAYAYHYLSQAKRNFRGYLRTDLVRAKKYFYVLRTLLACRWIVRRATVPPMEFGRLVDGEMPDDPGLRAAVADLLARKRRGDELDRTPRLDVVNEFVDAEMARLAQAVPDLPAPPKPDAAAFDELFRAALADAWR